MLKITVLCAIILSACISAGHAGTSTRSRGSSGSVRVVDWPSRSSGRSINDENTNRASSNAIRVVQWPPKSNGRSSSNDAKTLVDPLRWVSAENAERYFEFQEGLKWIEMFGGKLFANFTQVSRVGSDESLVVVLQRSDKLYVKLAEGKSWWSWHKNNLEKYELVTGGWKKQEQSDQRSLTRSGVYLWSFNGINEFFLSVDGGSQWKWFRNGVPVAQFFLEAEPVNGEYPLAGGTANQFFTVILTPTQAWQGSSFDKKTLLGNGRFTQMGNTLEVGDNDSAKTVDDKTKKSKKAMNPKKRGSKDCRPSEDAKKDFLKFVLERDAKRVYRRTLKADEVCYKTCEDKKLVWTGSWGAVEPRDVTVCECKDPRVSSRGNNFDRHSKEVDESECEAVFCETMLDLHNKLRIKHQVDELTVDMSLSTSASVYAKKLASLGELQHSNSSEFGESLAYRMQSPAHRLTYKYCKKLGEQVTRMWYDEVNDYDFSTGKPRTDSANVSHFTQLVWADSTKLGCGLAVDSDPARQRFYGVARYVPIGNVDGQYKTNVKPASRLMKAVNWP